MPSLLSFLIIAEVNAANMDLYIFTDPNSRGDPLIVARPVTLVDGTVYYVDCVVKQATSPIDLTVDFQSVTWWNSIDGTERALLADLIILRRFQFTANVTSHNGRVLSCAANNDANVLLNNFNSDNSIDQTISVIVDVVGKY